MNLAAMLARAGLRHADRTALALGETPVRSYGEMAARAARLGGVLRHRYGLARGDRVALVMKNCPDYFELLFGCWHAGLAAVPVNAKLHATEFQYILADSGARLCVVTPDLASAVGGLALDGLKAVVEIGTAEYERLFEGEPLPLADSAPDDLAWLFYTSGTTGRPKGAMLSHRNLLAMSFCYLADLEQIEPGDAWLQAAPMSHGAGLYGLPQVMNAGINVVPESGGFEAAEIFRLIERWPRTSFFAAPTMVKRLLDAPTEADTGNLNAIVYGGGPMYVADSRAALDRFGPKLIQIYGQGESPMTITFLSRAAHAERDHPRWLERLGSVGIAQSAVQVRVADEQDRPLPTGAVGEVLVRGDAVMLGYWNQPDATAETLRGGWLHTGDMGSFDGEGFLTLKDRSKDLIISGGTNIYPREVEEVLLRHSDVAEVSVIGRSDPEWGETVVAYVVPRAGKALDAAALDAFCLEHLARFKRPKDYRSIESLPKNNYGKVLKTELRDRDAGRS